MHQTDIESGYTAVLYGKEDTIKFIEDQPKVRRVYPLTPDAKAELMGNTDLPMLDPIDYYTDYSHRRVLARVRKMERDLHPLLYKKKDLSSAAKETYRGMFHLLSCIVFGHWYLLKDSGPWLIYYRNSWCRCDELKMAHRMILEQVSIIGAGIFKPLKQRKVLHPGLCRLYNRFLIEFLRRKQCIWIPGTGYGMNELVKYIIDANSNTFILSISKNSAHPILQYLKQAFNVILKKERQLKIVMLPNSNRAYINSLNDELGRPNDFIFNNVYELSIPILTNAVNYTDSLVAYSHYFFYKTNPAAYLTYYMRWQEGAVLGEAAKKNGIRSILISHGSHPHCKDVSARYEHKELAQGLLTSSLATSLITQSPCAEITARDFMPHVTRQPFQPLMWSYKKIEKKPRSKNNQRTILHAGTYKLLGQRPWIYETSYEFVKGLQQLVEAVNKLKNARLVIRFRPTHECSVSSLKKLLPPSGKLEIKTEGSFLDDLKNADLLISYSSTTIEEALYAGKPVGLFGGSDRYRHLPGSATSPTGNNRSAVYHLSKQNLVTMLASILDVHDSRPLSDVELDGYVWPDNIQGREEFVEEILQDNNGYYFKPTTS